MWSKKRLDILPKIKSQDKFNRQSMPCKKDLDIPASPTTNQKNILKMLFMWTIIFQTIIKYR